MNRQKLFKPLFKYRYIHIAIIGLYLRLEHLMLNDFEGFIVCTFALQQKFQNLVDFFRLQLLVNGVEIL